MLGACPQALVGVVQEPPVKDREQRWQDEALQRIRAALRDRGQTSEGKVPDTAPGASAKREPDRCSSEMHDRGCRGSAQPRLGQVPDIAQAIGYSLVRWKALTRYVDDGRHGDRQQRGRTRAARRERWGASNYLFMGSDAGGERAAAFYSLVETAKLNGLDPQAYLCEVMERIADHPINRVDELLPWNIGRGRADAELQRAA